MTDLTTTRPARDYTVVYTAAEQAAHSTTTARHSSTQAGTTPSTTTLVGTDTASSVQITLSQAGLDFLANSTVSATSEQTSAQEALARLDQLARSSHTAAREEAEDRVNNLKAQMRQLIPTVDCYNP